MKSKKSVLQFIKFCMVGVSNTIISYSSEMLFYYIIFSSFNDNIRILSSNAIAFILSVTNSFYWNNKYVFSNDEKQKKKELLFKYLKTFTSYSFTGLVIAPLVKFLLLKIVKRYWMISFISIIVLLPINFILNKYWAFRNETK